jgi:SWI/SNF-related matrix-associated actin-dependent regulator of chromatin subfamily B protein 1
MCAAGKFWHRHRRPRPVLYNPDPEYHLGLRTETDKSKIYPKKKGGAAARAANTPVVDQDEPAPATAPEPETPSKTEPVVEVPRRGPSTGRRHVDNERPVSPVSSGSSSASESPLIQKMKLNGTGHSKSDSNTPMPPPATDDVSSALPGHSDRPKSPAHTAEVREKLLRTFLPLSRPLQDMPPHSLVEARAAMNAKYPDDRFDIWPRTAPSGEQEWRVKCLDCPGKVRSNCDLCAWR